MGERFCVELSGRQWRELSCEGTLCDSAWGMENARMGFVNRKIKYLEMVLGF
jgi:hypothetical protein